MHELSLAQAVVEEVVNQARTHGMKRVQRVVLRIGELRAVVPDAIQLGLKALAEGTCAAEAQFELHEDPARARCRNCGREFGPKEFVFACPGCGKADVEVIAGWDMIIDFIEGEDGS